MYHLFIQSCIRCGLYSCPLGGDKEQLCGCPDIREEDRASMILVTVYHLSFISVGYMYVNILPR